VSLAVYLQPPAKTIPTVLKSAVLTALLAHKSRGEFKAINKAPYVISIVIILRDIDVDAQESELLLDACNFEDPSLL